MVDLSENHKALPFFLCWSGIFPIGKTKDKLESNNLISQLDQTAFLMNQLPDMAVSTKIDKFMDEFNTELDRTNSIEVEHLNQQKLKLKLKMYCGPTFIELLCHLWCLDEQGQTQLKNNSNAQICDYYYYLFSYIFLH